MSEEITIKPEEILTFLGYEAKDLKTIDEFKTKFGEKFGIKEDLLKDKDFTSKIFGQRLGSIEAKLKSHAKKMAVEFTPEEIKDKTVEEIQEITFTKIAEMNAKAMEDVVNNSKGTVDEQVKTWKEKATATETKLKDTEALLIKTTTDYEGFKAEAITKGKTDTLSRFKTDAIAKLAFKQNVTPVEKAGFDSVIASKYEFDLDENNAPYVKDKTSGQRIASTKVVGQFKSIDEILQTELIDNKLAIINGDGGKPAPKAGLQLDLSVPTEKKLYIHPNARTATAAAPVVG